MFWIQTLKNKGSGTGPANEEARVYINTDQGDYEYVLTVELDGTWSIDYGALGFTFNEVYYASVNICVDEDSDTTREHYYPPVQDFDNDGIPDNQDPDDDNDGQSDVDETACGSDPFR